MSAEISIVAAQPPHGTAWHANPAEHLQWLVQYLHVVGYGDFKGINFGVQTPSAQDRDKPWYRINAEGNLMGWYGWSGSAWSKAADIAPHGPTANRPANPVTGSVYFDTDLKASIIYERNAWRLDDGNSPGTLKMWDGPTADAALAANPGYSIFSRMAGRSPMGAGLGDGLTERVAGETLGNETHALTVDENAPHNHGFSVPRFPGDGSGTFGSGGSNRAADWTGTTSTAGQGKPHNNLHPVYVCWVLRKD